MKLSPFRTGFLLVELFINGAWVDVTGDLSDDGVSIKRGREDESGEVSPGIATMKLRNPDGRYSPRNPAGIYYGLIGRGTPVRVATEHTAGQPLYRFWGEITSWPQGWSRTGSPSAYATLECAGPMRRLNQSGTIVGSALRRYEEFNGLSSYWPMESGTDADVAGAATVGDSKARRTAGVTFGAYSGLASSDDLPTLGNGILQAFPKTYSVAARPTSTVRWVHRIPTGVPTGVVIARIEPNDGPDFVDIVLNGVNLNLRVTVNGVATTVANVTSANRNVPTWYQFVASPSGGTNTTLSWSIYSQPFGGTLQVASGTIVNASLGRVTRVAFNATGAAAADTAVGHLTVGLGDAAFDTIPFGAHAGELASARITRLAAENNLTASTIYVGAPTSAEAMGFQRSTTLRDLLYEAAATGGGILFEPRDSAQDLVYRSLESEYLTNQTPVTIPYVDNLLRPFVPVEDDQATRNKVTVTREGGASATITRTDGNLGTSAVGIYDEQVTLSLFSDTQTDDQAQWRVTQGTVDEERFPTIGVALEDSYWFANTALRQQVLGIDLGAYLRVTNIPAWLRPFPVEVIVQGYEEKITPLSHEIVFNCTPASPLNVLRYNNTATRFSGIGTVTAAALTTTQTTFTVIPPAGVAWTSADGSYDLNIGGEIMTVTNVTGNVFTVVRSVNGVVKTHPAGSAVNLSAPSYYAL